MRQIIISVAELNCEHKDPCPDEGLHIKIEQLDLRIREHPGKRLVDRLERLKRTLEAWAGFSRGLSEYLSELETDPDLHVELMRNWGDQTRKSLIIRQLDKNIIAYTAGLGAVIDQARSVVKMQGSSLQSRYEARGSRVVQEHPAAPFLWKLRNHVLHNVAAPWRFRISSSGESSTCEVSLDVKSLLEDKRAWNSDARDFIRGCGDSVRLLPLIDPYFQSMLDHVGRLLPEAIEANISSIQACDALMKELNLLLTGGASDGSDWEERMIHLEENIRRFDRGESSLDFSSGLPIIDEGVLDNESQV